MRLPKFDSNILIAAFDTETTGLNWWEHRPFGISVSYGDEDFYWDIRKEPKIIDWIRDEFVGWPIKFAMHNSKFDQHMMMNFGVFFDWDKIICTQIQACLINEHEHSYSLDNLSQKYCNAKKDVTIYEKLAKIFGGLATKNVQMPNIHKAPPELVGPYAKADTRATLELARYQLQEIQKQKLEDVLKLEMELLPVIIEMERGGVRVDIARAERAVDDITIEIDSLQRNINNLAGFEVNPNPSKSLENLFKPTFTNGVWYACDGTKLNSTPAGKASLNKEALEKMVHPAAKKILEYRKIAKCRDTFLKGHVLGHAHKGYVYPNINQCKGEDGGTGTGRLSYNSPALQQIPARDKKVASIMRPIFIADENQEWGCWDYEQFEFRMFAHYVNNPKINAMFANNPSTDFHQLVADMTGLPRSAKSSGGANAKQLNLGMVFCMGGGLMAQQMGLPYTLKTVNFGNEEREIMVAGDEAQKVMDLYHSTIPGVKDIAKKATSLAKSRGYVRTIDGRHIRFPHGQFTHKASGLIYQGSSAGCMKQKMVEVSKFLLGTNARMLMSVHDEISISMPHDSKEIICEITRILENFDGIECPYNLRIPIRTDFGKGPNWAIASGKGD